MDARLDRLLDASAPPVAERSDHLDRDLAALVADTEAMTGRGRRRTRRLGFVGLAVAGLLGAGTAATAAGLVPLPWFDEPTAVHGTHQTPPGEPCQVTYAAREFEDPAHPVTPTNRAAALAEAQDFLAGLDPARIGADKSPAAAFREINTALSRHLEAKGLSTYAVGVAEADDCSTGSGR